MTVRIATVLSAMEWEPRLVAHARETAEVGIVLRAFQPDEIEERRSDIDIVVAGAEVSWVTPTQIAAWRRAGLGVIGVHAAGDAPAVSMLSTAGVDELVSDDTDPEGLITAIRFLGPRTEQPVAEQHGRAIAVIGARGAPGITEVALGMAVVESTSHSTVLIDLDIDAPSLAIRLGLTPRPDITDVADQVRASGSIPPESVHRVGALDVITGSHREGEITVRPTMIEDVVEVASTGYDRVVLDLGAAAADDHVLKRSDAAILVVDGSAIGIVRAARLVSEWSGPPPRIAINRAARHEHDQLTDAVTHWTGIAPEVVIEDRRSIRASSLDARPPERYLLRTLAALTR